VMDYPCGKLGDCSFSRLGFIVWHSDTQTPINALLPRLSAQLANTRFGRTQCDDWL